MSPKKIFYSVAIRIIILLVAFLNLKIESSIIFWSLILIFSYRKMKNHFISVLLILEILSLLAFLIRGLYLNFSKVLTLIFILITLRVGEAVLGLAILVKLTRANSNELILIGLK